MKLKNCSSAINQPETLTNKIQTTDSDSQAYDKKLVSPPPSASRFSRWAIFAFGLIAVLACVVFFAARSGWQMNWRQNEQNTLGGIKTSDLPKSTVGNALSIAVLPFTTVNAKTMTNNISESARQTL